MRSATQAGYMASWPLVMVDGARPGHRLIPDAGRTRPGCPTATAAALSPTGKSGPGVTLPHGDEASAARID